MEPEVQWQASLVGREEGGVTGLQLWSKLKSCAFSTAKNNHESSMSKFMWIPTTAHLCLHLTY
jgi:hypothetical protein